MSQAARKRPARKPGLFRYDVEIAAELGVSVEKWMAATHVLKGLPPRDPLFGGRRYLPAVRAFLDRRYGVGAASSPAAVRDWEEKFHAGK